MTTKNTIKHQDYLLELHFKRPKVAEMPRLQKAEDTYQYLRDRIDKGRINHKEYFWIIVLTQSNHVLGLRQLSSGTTNATLISFKEIAQIAILANACGCILAHNHPSGNLKPSRNDVRITKKAKEALALFEIKLLDHLILTEESYYSFANEGEI